MTAGMPTAVMPTAVMPEWCTCKVRRILLVALCCCESEDIASLGFGRFITSRSSPPMFFKILSYTLSR